MHELSIILSIVETAENFAIENNALRVIKITLQVGELSGIDPQYIKDCFPLIITGTVLEGLELEIKTIQTSLLCKCCNTKFNTEAEEIKCPNCGRNQYEIIEGRDIFIDEITIEEPSPSEIDP